MQKNSALLKIIEMGYGRLDFRFFVQDRNFEDSVFLSEEDSKHLIKVLRAKIGDSVMVCDGNGKEAVGTITSLGVQAALELSNITYNDEENKLIFHALPSVSKGDRFEWMLQKLVELGVTSVTPVISENCVAKFPDDNKLERWNRIMLESAKQSKRLFLPILNKPISFIDAVNGENYGEKIICYEKERSFTLQNAISCGKMDYISVLTGPEGGYTLNEAKLAAECNWKSVTLGKRILRCETAPVAVLAALQFL